jgi:hypothetical protein
MKPTPHLNQDVRGGNLTNEVKGNISERENMGNF